MVVSYGKKGTREFGVCIRGRQVFCSCSDFRERGVHCKHIAAVALHELGAQAQARSERCEVVELVGWRGKAPLFPFFREGGSYRQASASL